MAALPLRPLIITQNVNFAFENSFVINFLGSGTVPFDGENSSPINLLISPLAGVDLPDSFGPFLSQEPPRLNVFFGSAGNKELIRKIIDEKKINAIFLFLEEESEDKEEANQIVARTRQFLIGQLCPLLEAIRQCSSQPNRPTIVPIFFEPPNANFLQSNEHVQQKGPIPTVQCQSQASVRFSSAHALLHSFAVSYRLNIQIAFLPIQPTNDAIKFVMELAQIQGGNARIHRFSTEKAIIDEGNEATEMKPNSGQIRLVRVLIFGHLASVDRAKLSEQIGEISIEKLMEAETKPGLDVDEAIEAELLAKGPTHVGVTETDEKTLADWEAGGPAQLRENVRQNLFTPWLLRQICAKFGIHFFTLNLNPSKNAQGSIEANNRCAVVSHFADKLAKLDLEFGNQN